MMFPTTRRRTTMTIPLLISLLTGGCEPDSGEDAEFPKEVARQQAAQHKTLLKHSDNISKASQQLVAADATARKELSALHSHLQRQFEAERRQIDAERDKLESERRDIAGQRQRDPLIAAAIQQGVTLLIAALPFVLALLLMRDAQREPADVPLAELLVNEFAAETPRLLPAPPNNRPPDDLPPTRSTVAPHNLCIAAPTSRIQKSGQQPSQSLHPRRLALPDDQIPPVHPRQPPLIQSVPAFVAIQLGHPILAPRWFAHQKHFDFNLQSIVVPPNVTKVTPESPAYHTYRLLQCDDSDARSGSRVPSWSVSIPLAAPFFPCL